MALAVRATIGVCHPLPRSFRRIAAVASTPVLVAEDNPVNERSFGDAQIWRLRRVPCRQEHTPRLRSPSFVSAARFRTQGCGSMDVSMFLKQSAHSGRAALPSAFNPAS
jgi:hypothetical protein